MRTKLGVLITGLSLSLSLAAGCALPAAPLQPHPRIVATPTPATGQLTVLRAQAQDEITTSPLTPNITSGDALGLDLATKPLGVFIVVAAELHNTGNVAIDLRATDIHLQDSADHVYARTAPAELALTLLDAPALPSRTIPAGTRVVGLMVFDAAASYAPPLTLTAHLPNGEMLRSTPFTPEVAP